MCVCVCVCVSQYCICSVLSCARTCYGLDPGEPQQVPALDSHLVQERGTLSHHEEVQSGHDQLVAIENHLWG